MSTPPATNAPSRRTQNETALCGGEPYLGSSGAFGRDRRPTEAELFGDRGGGGGSAAATGTASAEPPLAADEAEVTRTGGVGADVAPLADFADLEAGDRRRCRKRWRMEDGVVGLPPTEKKED